MVPIKSALLSFGLSGRVFHAPFLQGHPGFELYSVWERSRNQVQEYYPGVKSFRTLDEILRDEEVEMVVVNTPNYSHFEYTEKALLAGKHVVVEKPFTATVTEAQHLIRLAEKTGKQLAVYHNRRYDSDFKTAKDVLQKGLLGEIVEAEIRYDRFKEELSPKPHKEIPGPATGVLYDLGSHLIDQALELFGPPESLFADLRILRPGSQVDDYFEVLLYYPQLRVRLHSTYIAREPGPGFILHGRKGSFLKSRADVQETQLQNNLRPGAPGWGREPENEQGLIHTEVHGKAIREGVPTFPGNYMDYFEALYHSIRHQKPVPVSGNDGLAVIQIIEAAYKSSAQKTVVKL